MNTLAGFGQLLSRIAAAPISFGVYGDIRLDLSPRELLSTIAESGHSGSELGPPKFFGPRAGLRDLFVDARLTPVAAYVPIHLAGDEEAFTADLDGLRKTLDEITASGNLSALVVFGDSGDRDLKARPFRGEDPRLGAGDWLRAVQRLTIATAVAADAGVGTTYHPHFATFVEKPSEIDRLLETTDLSLCLDTGHFQIAGADPLEYFIRYRSRINHVHVKDVRLAVFEDARRRNLPGGNHPWWNDLSCRLGEGDVDLVEFIDELVAGGYDGWLVIEQDRAPVDRTTWESAVADQRHNVSWMKSTLSASYERRKAVPK